MPNNKYQVGDRIGPDNIELVEKLPSKGGHSYGNFICPHCSEHKIFYARISHVANGQIRSCGCLAYKARQKTAAITGKKNKINILGQKFGHLTVVEETSQRIDRKVVWKCQCDCKNHTIVYVTGKDLRAGHTTSCGCVKSQGEQQIQQLLNIWNECYIKEATFDECVNPKTGYQLRFDFFLPEYNLCIEYDGEQHFTGWRGKNDLKEAQYKDSIKNQYCKDNNIELVRIHYQNFSQLFKVKNLEELCKLNYNFKAKE